MLKEWFSGKQESKEETAVKTDKKPVRMVLDPEKAGQLTDDEKQAERDASMSKKLKESAREGPPHPQSLVAYDSIFRSSSRVLMEGNMQEQNEGLQINMSRNAQNTMVSSKWSVGNPQMSHWEVSMQMNGFSDVTAVTYNTMNRWQLMYQRVFRSGAMGVAQFLSQPQGGMNMGTFFGMIQYPWVQGGCTQVQYVKQQAVTVSHMQRLVRGIYCGSSLNYDLNTHGTTVSYGFSATNPSKTGTLAGEVKPESGEWKVAYTRADWGTDQEISTQLEFTEKRNGKISLLSIGLRKQLIGGGLVDVVLSGFSKLRAVVEIPFGCERPGFNQVRLSYNANYDLHTGGFKHGMAFTV